MEMEEAGILLDTGYLAELATRIDARLAEITQSIHALAGQDFNINSPLQLKKILLKS